MRLKRTLLCVGLALAGVMVAVSQAAAELPPANPPMEGSFTWNASPSGGYDVRLVMTKPLPQPLQAIEVVSKVEAIGHVADVGKCTPEPGDEILSVMGDWTMNVTKVSYNSLTRHLRSRTTSHPANFLGRRSTDFFTPAYSLYFPADYSAPEPDGLVGYGASPYEIRSEVYDHGAPAPVLEDPVFHSTVPEGFDSITFYTRIYGNCPPRGDPRATGSYFENLASLFS